MTNSAATAEFLRQQNLLTQKENELKQLITQANNAINVLNSTTATTTRRGLAQLTTANNVTDVNAYALSGTEKNPNISGSLMNQLISRYNDAISLVPGTVYDIYNTQQIDVGNGGHHLLALHIPVTGVYVVSAGIRHCASSPNNVGDGLTVYVNNSNSPTDISDPYRGSAGSSVGKHGIIFHLSANPILTVQANQYINLVVYCPPIHIYRRYISAVLLRRL